MHIKKLSSLRSLSLTGFGLGLALFLGTAHSQISESKISNPYVPVQDEEYEKKPWQEIEAQLPPLPREENLLPFFVSATAANTFRIDGASISIAEDGVVRYVLVVQSPSGAKNISFEGLRCETKERRLYAFGHPDGSWSKARSNQWVGVENSIVNRHHAELMQRYFCPGGYAIRSAAEGVAALKAGGHPGAAY